MPGNPKPRSPQRGPASAQENWNERIARFSGDSSACATCRGLRGVELYDDDARVVVP